MVPDTGFTVLWNRLGRRAGTGRVGRGAGLHQPVVGGGPDRSPVPATAELILDATQTWPEAFALLHGNALVMDRVRGHKRQNTRRPP